MGTFLFCPGTDLGFCLDVPMGMSYPCPLMSFFSFSGGVFPQRDGESVERAEGSARCGQAQHSHRYVNTVCKP